MMVAGDWLCIRGLFARILLLWLRDPEGRRPRYDGNHGLCPLASSLNNGNVTIRCENVVVTRNRRNGPTGRKRSGGACTPHFFPFALSYPHWLQR